MCGMKFPQDENVLVGLTSADDAGVYRITPEIALIQTVDFFTPIVDDPYDFGRIAAANALSDVYAMGGVPKTAMNLVGFPSKTMDLSILRQILEGGIAIMEQAGVSLVGGHSVEDPELKYGLSVTGLVHPDRMLTKRNLQPGDVLVLTKPIGTGIINTAIKAGFASAEITAQITEIMAHLNKTAAETMAGFSVHACTDVTGFGLLGHLAEMVDGSGAGVRVFSQKIPLFPEVFSNAQMGMFPAGAYKNRDFRSHMVDVDPAVDPVLADLLFDPQTSGGLLIALPAREAGALTDALAEKGETGVVVGEVIAEPANRIRVE